MKKVMMIFIAASSLVLAKENLKFEIKQKASDDIHILITRDEKVETKKVQKVSLSKNDKVYVIKTGDTLSKIARKYNKSIRLIANKNNISDINLIRTGQNLIISE